MSERHQSESESESERERERDREREIERETHMDEQMLVYLNNKPNFSQ